MSESRRHAKTLRRGAALTLAGLIGFSGTAGILQAQGFGTDITLTKVVEVYDFEGQPVSIDHYEVVRGDSLASILKQRGLLTGASQARLMRLVRALNPDLKNPNLILPGQTLALPAAPGDETGRAPAARVNPEAGPETVKTYQRRQPGQQPATVVVKNDRPAGHPFGEPAQFSSGNDGPLEVGEDGLVYRRVQVRPGDTLERLLRREGMSPALIYGQLLKITLKLNPKLSDPDLILAGAELRIPAAGPYLAGLGVDPGEIETRARAAARNVPQAERPALPALPEAAASRRRLLTLLLTRLGAQVTGQGQVNLAARGGPVALDAAFFPTVELTGGRKLILDMESRLPADLAAALNQGPDHWRVFQAAGREPLGPMLARLWPLCGYYRVYDRGQSYEGGAGARLTITADWLIWPTEAAWRAGQPLAVNLAEDGRPTPSAWAAFLRLHGIEVVDVTSDGLLTGAAPPAGELPDAVGLNTRRPSFLAAALVGHLGGQARIGLPPDLGLAAEEAEKNSQTAPVFWENGPRKVALDFGQISGSATAALRRAGYRVIESGVAPEEVLKAVLAGFDLQAGETLALENPGPGPRLRLTLPGLYFSKNQRTFLFTRLAPLPGLGSLAPALTVLSY